MGRSSVALQPGRQMVGPPVHSVLVSDRQLLFAWPFVLGEGSTLNSKSMQAERPLALCHHV